MDPREIRLLRAISNIGKRPKMEVLNFSGSLNLQDLIDWINDMEDFFEFEDIEEPH